MGDLTARVAEVQGRMAAAARGAGRDPAAVKLVAVTKSWSPEVVVAAWRAGLRHFGENRTDEFVAKQAAVAELLAGEGLDQEQRPIWHFIGTLQSRQTHDVADHADLFHALDRLKIARRLSNRLVDNGRLPHRPLPVFLEVNVSGEASKAGFDCRRWESDARQRAALRQAAVAVAGYPGLQLRGLMTMAPWEVAEAIIRDVFQRTRALAGWLQEELPDQTLDQLSMGMTDDFEIAIEEGATHIRVGRALFGERAG